MRNGRLISLLLAAVALSGCAIKPPLFLRQAATVQVQVVTKVDVDVMWQVNWETAWKFNWNVTALGPVGYTAPASVRMHIYTHGPDGNPIAHTVHNFMGATARMDVFEGTHDLLFHNNDSEALLFRSEDELRDLSCYTRNISSGLKTSTPVYTMQQKAMGMTKADDLEEEPVSLPPEQLFTLYDPGRVITSNPDDYIYEDGKYILRIQSVLEPATYIHLFQIWLRNNDGRVIGSDGGAALTSMAAGVDVMSRHSFASTVSVPMDVYLDKPQDLLGARVMTFGIPDCNPYDAASVAAAPEHRHYLVLSVSYINGSYRNIRIDVTDEVLALPLGGVIDLELDVNDFPPDSGAGGSGGFNALIDGWNEETGHTTIKQ